MKPFQLAELLNVSSDTIRRWARKEYRDFLSPDAQGGNSLQRSFTEHDARILAWVATMRAAGETPVTITATLQSAQVDNWRGLPPLPGTPAAEDTVAMIPVEAVKARMEAMQNRMQDLERERDDLAARLAKSEAQNDDLQRELLDLTKRILSLHEAERRRRK